MQHPDRMWTRRARPRRARGQQRWRLPSNGQAYGAPPQSERRGQHLPGGVGRLARLRRSSATAAGTCPARPKPTSRTRSCGSSRTCLRASPQPGHPSPPPVTSRHGSLAPSRGSRPATWMHYESLVRLYLVPHLGSTPLTRLVPSQVEHMTTQIKSGHGPTAWAARRALRVALNDAARDGLIARNSAALARAPKVVRQTLTVLDADQIRTLVSGTEADPAGPLLATLVLTGIRIGEASGLRWRDVDSRQRPVARPLMRWSRTTSMAGLLGPPRPPAPTGPSIWHPARSPRSSASRSGRTR